MFDLENRFQPIRKAPNFLVQTININGEASTVGNRVSDFEFINKVDLNWQSLLESYCSSLSLSLAASKLDTCVSSFFHKRCIKLPCSRYARLQRESGTKKTKKCNFLEGIKYAALRLTQGTGTASLQWRKKGITLQFQYLCRKGSGVKRRKTFWARKSKS